MKYQVDENGFFGHYGGTYVPEILYNVVHELQEAYNPIIESEEFKTEYRQLLRDYVGRPSPLYHAKRMSEKYGCRLYLKREDLNHTGAHKINNTIGQILLARKMGKTRIIAETGAGQHGVATATVCALMGMHCEIFMGKTDVERQHINVERMKMLGAIVHPVTTGNMTLSDACSEAIRDWCCHPRDTFYLVGSTMGPHPYPDIVAKMQSVISEEIKMQLEEKIGRDYPDCLIACVGGGSNAAGTIYHYIDDERVKIVLAEAGGHGIGSDYTAATIHCGTEGIIHGARSLVMQTDDGQIKEAFTISAGLDYPGIGPMHADLAEKGREKVFAINDDEAIYAGYELTRMEGIVPAIESAHAIAALKKLSFNPEDVVVLTVSGRGDKDVETYLKNKAMAKEYANF
ncbi:tryptophan synthase subunit beta [Prevotella sp. KH2C16]|uniref:tryptophan synthase subunit beta n=1 Tax=Prevotella sp. KH2C16 TaxID=1855325 RepID=UPI0008EBAEEA|nr:tryptophan synthase subunit beta [Prevotella sp. KH2C16]SFF93517.1 tryptophan synthase beta chain [Prevotella sp. KH2C16]